MKNKQNILWNEVKGICPYCGKKMMKIWEREVYIDDGNSLVYNPMTKQEWQDSMEIDHINGNKTHNDFGNLIGCCKLCNIRKGNKNLGYKKENLVKLL